MLVARPEGEEGGSWGSWITSPHRKNRTHDCHDATRGLARRDPVEGDWLQELGERPWEGPSLPRFRSDWRDLFTDLMTQHLYLGLYRAFAESLASENAARLQSMAGAEDNVKQQIRQLRDRYHRTRQSLVTEELLDLTSGYAALSDVDPRNYGRSG